MRILHLIPHLSGGGAERQLSYLAPELAKRGHSNHIAYLYNADTAFFQNTNVTLHPLHSCCNYDLRMVLQIRRLIKQIKPHILQSWILQADVIAALSVKKSDVLWVIRESNAPSLRSNRKIKGWIRKQAGRWSDGIVANSLSGAEYWKKQYPAKQICLIRNGFPIENIINCPTLQLDFAGLEPNVRYLLFLGRFDPQKNLKTLLNAMCHLSADIKLILAGSGPLEGQIRQQIDALNLQQRIILAGYLPKEQAWTLMRKVQATVLISHFEGFPNGLLEAMICRCPLMVSDIPPHREFLDETTACFVNKDNPKSIAEGILQALDLPGKTAARAENAFRVATQFSINKMTDEYEAFYSRLLNCDSV